MTTDPADSLQAADEARALPRRFRKKPVEIEAVQIPDAPWDARTVEIERIAEWCGGTPGFISPCVLIQTLEGVMIGALGDWIIRGIAGEFYPCKPDIFAATYEPISAPNTLARLRAAEAERDELRAALSSCAGFLVGLRDDNHGYDFTVAHNEQIARLCHEAWNALARYREVAG